MINSLGGFLSAIADRITNSDKKDYEAAQIDRKIADATKALAILTACLAGVTALSVVVLVLQWQTFEKTDRTIRGGERAFVYLSEILPQKITTSAWLVNINVTNNGTTQATNFNYVLHCNDISKKFDSMFVGPKEVANLGSCPTTDDSLDKLWHTHQPFRVGGTLFYQDIFSDSHWTRFCRMVLIDADPKMIRPGGTLPVATSRCPDELDCVDKQCRR